jgi:hypothetical protein
MKAAQCVVCLVMAIAIVQYFWGAKNGEHLTDNGSEARSTRVVMGGPNQNEQNKPRGKSSTQSPKNKKSIPSPAFLSKNPRWRPIWKFHVDSSCMEVLGLTIEEFTSFQQIVGNLRVSAGHLQALDCLVTTKPDGAQLAYIKPNETIWAGLEDKFRSELIELLGSSLAEYVFKSSSMEIDLLTGRFGKLGRMVEVFSSQKSAQNHAIGSKWTARIYIGHLSGAHFGQYFSEGDRAFLQQGNAPNFHWQELYEFRETPDFLSSLITFK